MKVRRLILFPFLILFILSALSHSLDKPSTLILPFGSGTLPVNVRASPLLGSHVKDTIGMWLGKWESSEYRGMTGMVKVTIYQVNQKLRGTVELERTVLGDVMIQISGTLIERIFIARGTRAGYSYMIQGRLREKVLSGTYHVWVPFEKHHDWGWFQVELLEIPEDSQRI